MFIQLRETIYLGDEAATKDMEALKKAGITSIVVVADELPTPSRLDEGIKTFKVGLVQGANYGHIKDLACHIPKYLSQNGETVLIQGKTGLIRGAFVAARTVCEMENKSIYEVFQEIKDLVPELSLTKVYL